MLLSPEDAARNARILGFESLADWSTSSGTLGQSVLRTEGSYSLAVSSSGWSELESQVPIRFGSVGSRLSLDLFLVQQVSWGEVRVILEAPSAHLYWETIGTRSLAGLSAGEWHTIQFQLDAAVIAALEGASDGKVRIALNSPEGTKYFDRLHFDVPPDSGGTGGGSSGSGGSASGTGGAGPGGSGNAALNEQILGFEVLSVEGRGAFTASCSNCSGAVGLALAGQPSSSTQGARALELTIPGTSSSRYDVELLTPQLTRLDVVTDTVGFDLRIPPQTHGSSFGAVQLFVHAPSAGIYNQWIGQKELNGAALYQGLFRRVQFALPEFVRSRLSSENYSDLQFRFVLAQVPAGTYGFDWLALREQFPPVVPPAPSRDIDQVLGFETLAGWDVTGTNQLSLGDEFTQGGYSICARDFTQLTLKSVNLSSLGTTNGELSFDVKLPGSLSATETVGVNAFLSIPSQSVWRAHVGWISVPGRAAEEANVFHNLRFTLPAALRQAVETTQYGDLSVELSFTLPRAVPNELFCVDDVDLGHVKFADVGRAPVTRRQLDVDLPSGLTPASVALYMGQVGNRSRASGVQLTTNVVVNGDIVSTGWFSSGVFFVRPNAFSSSTHVYVREEARLYAGSEILGSLWASQIEPSLGTVQGQTQLGATFRETTNYRWSVEAPLIAPDAPSVGGVPTIGGGAGELAPGVYGTLSLGIAETLTLVPGTYYFKKVILNGGTVRLRNDLTGSPAQDSIRVIVDGSFSSSAEVIALDPTHNNVWWVQLGTDNPDRSSSSGGTWGERRAFQVYNHFFGSVWTEGTFTLYGMHNPEDLGRPLHVRHQGAVFSSGGVSLADAHLLHLPPLSLSGPCGFCDFNLGCVDLNVLDGDRDGLSTCEEEADGSGWTDPSVFNGMNVTLADAEHTELDASLLDTEAKLDALFAGAPLEGQSPSVREQSWGWDAISVDSSICNGSFLPGWAECAAGPKLIQLRGSLYFEMRGKHCFQFVSNGSAAYSFFMNGELLSARDSGGSSPAGAEQTACVELSAGAHALRYAVETGEPTGAVHLRHCFGGGEECVPREGGFLSSSFLRAHYDSEQDEIACSTDPLRCTELCPCEGYSPCSDDNVCTVDICNYPAPGLNRYLPVALDDGDPCTIDSCDPVEGVKHLPPSDGNACTEDLCDPVLGELHVEPDDGNPCTQFVCDSPETGGRHVFAPDGALSDGDVCTLDVCDPVLGLIHPPAASAAGACVDLQASSCSSSSGVQVSYQPEGSECAPGKQCSSSGACVYPGVVPPSFPAGQVTVTPEELIGRIPRFPAEDCPLEEVSAERLLVVRGRVFYEHGTEGALPLEQAEITVAGHCEYGRAWTRSDGSYEFAIPGGGRHVIRAQKRGEVTYLPVDRPIEGYTGDNVAVESVVLIPAGVSLGVVDVSLSSQMIQGPVFEDLEGQPHGRASVFFSQGTSFKVVREGMPDVVLSEPPELRITPFTSGPNGPARMLALLPPGTHYTHAFDISLIEADELGGEVELSSPAVYYIDNLRAGPWGTALTNPAMDAGANGLGVTLEGGKNTGRAQESDYAVGAIVPSFYYNSKTAAWERLPDGRIIELQCTGGVLSKVEGLQAEEGLETGEFQQLAGAVASGDRACGAQLWRVELQHFSPHDLNYYMNIAAQVVATLEDPRAPEGTLCGTTKATGSVIEVESRVLRESLELPGLEQRLHYNSDAMFGDMSGRYVPIVKFRYPIEWTLPIKDIEERVSHPGGVSSSGSNYGAINGPSGGGRKVSVVDRWWDGTVSGARVYGTFPASSSREERWRETIGNLQISGGYYHFFSATVRSHDAKTRGLGGWTLSGLHAYDAKGSILYRGDTGVQRNVAEGVVERIWETDLVIPDSAISQYQDTRFHVLRDGSVVVRGLRGAQGGLFLLRSHPGSAVPSYQQISPSERLAGFAVDPRDESIWMLDRSWFTRPPLPGGWRNRLYRLPAPKTWPAGQVPPLELIYDFGDETLSTPNQPRFVAGFALARNGDPLVAMLDTAVINSYNRTKIYRLSGGVLSKPLFEMSATRAPVLLVASQRDEEVIYAAAYSASTSSNASTQIVAKWSREEGLQHLLGTRSHVGVPLNEGALARSVSLPMVKQIDEAEDGSVLFSVYDNHAIWRIEKEGSVSIVTGTNQREGSWLEISRNPSPPGLSPRRSLLSAWGMSFARGPTGEYWVASPVLPQGASWGFRYRFQKLRNVELMQTSEGILVPSEDGAEVYRFAPDGRHLETWDTKTKARLRKFNYDPSSLLLVSFEERGQLNSVVRTNDSVKITSAFGQESILGLDSSGYAAGIQRQDGGSTHLMHDTSGLLRQMIDAKGRIHLYEYDQHGRLLKDESPDGADQILTREGLTNGEGEELKVSFSREDRGGKRSVTYSDGSGYSLTSELEKSTEKIRSDGTVEKYEWGTHPVLPQVRSALRSSVRLPGGQLLSREWSATSTESTWSPNPESAVWTDKYRTNGVETVVETRSTPGQRQVVVTTARGRRVVVALNDQGQPISVQQGNLSPIQLDYDSYGRLTKSSREGAEQSEETLAEFSYWGAGQGSGAGYLMQASADGVTTSFTRDAFGRAKTSVTFGEVLGLSYDVQGNLTSVRNGAEQTQGLTYNSVNLLSGYVPSEGGGTAWTWDKARRLKEVHYPSSGTNARVELVRDGVNAPFPGRLRRSIERNGSGVRVTSLNYGDELFGEPDEEGKPQPVGKPGQVARVSRAPFVSNLKHNGSLLVREEREALTFARVSYEWTPDNFFRAVSDKVEIGGETASEAAYSYNADGQLRTVSAGATTLHLDWDGDYSGDVSNGQHGLIEGVRVGETRDAYSYDEHGRLSSFESTGLNPLEDSRESLVQIEYERSVGGRLTKEILSQSGSVRDRSYTYNGQGRLESVTEDGSTKWYQYDRAGNRVHAWSAPEVPCDPMTQIPACDTRYDADDRVVSSEGVTHQFDARGVLKSKTSPGGITEYGYDLHGALERVESTNGLAIEYENDPFSRRAIKKRNGVVVSQYVWSDGLRIQAELDRFGGLKHRFLYGTRVNVPDLILRTVPGGTKTYRVITDHLGSPLVVVNVEDASDIWLEAEYDVWGKVTRLEVEGVSAPLSAWPIPFGYAGGLYDGETGLVRFGARDYDPTVGRWTAKDPILFGGGQSNLYVYVENDPVNFVDPTGEIAPIIAVGVVFGGGFASGLASYVSSGPDRSYQDFVFGASTGVIAGFGVISTALGAPVAGLVYGGIALGANVLRDTNLFQDSAGAIDTAFGAAGSSVCGFFAGPMAPFGCPFAEEAAKAASKECRD